MAKRERFAIKAAVKQNLGELCNNRYKVNLFEFDEFISACDIY